MGECSTICNIEEGSPAGCSVPESEVPDSATWTLPSALALSPSISARIALVRPAVAGDTSVACHTNAQQADMMESPNCEKEMCGKERTRESPLNLAGYWRRICARM